MDELERVKQVLEMHCGEGNEISAGIIGSMLGYSHDDTHAKARRIIKKCAEKYGIPLVRTPPKLHSQTGEIEHGFR